MLFDYIRGYTEFSFQDLLEMYEHELEFWRERSDRHYDEMRRMKSRMRR